MLAKQLCVLFATLVVPIMGASAGQPVVGGTSRWATFDASGTGYFAVSVQPDPSGSIPLPDRHEVVLLVDTSASQTGPVRLESLEVVDELLSGMPASAKLAVVASDVKSISLTEGLVAPGSPQLAKAIDRLKARVPLGTTNLGLALRTALGQFGEDASAQRTIVYIGDGVNGKQYLSNQDQKQLIESLVAKQATVTSFVIGPVVDVPALSALANQTGGILLSRNEITASMQEIGRALAESIHAPVLWPARVETPASLSKYLPAKFPPMRVDRDSVILGRTDGKAESGKLTVEAVVAGNPVTLRWNLTPEESHPDMGFLPTVCENAAKDQGLTLPALGSAGLRAMSYAMSDSSISLVKSGEFALKSGEIQNAIRLAEQALKVDPNNVEAQTLLNAAQEEAKKQIPTGKFMQTTAPQDDPFGAAPAAAPAQPPAEADPFGAAEPAPPAANPFGAEPAPAGANPFGTEPAPAAPAQPAPAAPGAAVPAAPLAEPAAPLAGPSDALAPMDTVPGVLDERFLSTGDLLADEMALRRVQSTAVEAQVNAQIREANRLMAADPTAVKNSLMALLEEVDQNVNLDPALRRTLDMRVRAALETAAKREAVYLDQLARTEAVRAQAAAAQRLLAESERRETALKQLVESFTFMMSQFRYLEASQEIAPEIEELAPATPLAAVVMVEGSMQANQGLLRDAFRRREQGFVDAMRGVEEAAVPFPGAPPIVYPPAEVWQRLSVRRKERYGSINLAADDSEQRIYNALREPAEVDFTGLPLRQVLDTFETKHGIDIYINETELDNLSVDPDTPITLSLTSATLRSALRIMLKPLDLTYVIREGTLQITSNDDANNDPINKIYPVGDIVVPPMSGGGMMGGMGGGMGGMGGGMMGGMGGMGGGMGGMGGGMMGGMGGMGGGMGGMGGGMGGMFAVPDQPAKTPAVNTPAGNSRAAKSAQPKVVPVAKPAPATPAPAKPAPAKPAPANGSAAAPSAPAQPAPAPLPLSSTASLRAGSDTWDDLVREYDHADEKAAKRLDSEVREMVTSLVASAQKAVEAGDDKAALKHFERVIALVNQMLRSGHPQPWMYQALSLSMKACDYPSEEIERVMLSSLDFSRDTASALEIASYFAQNQMKKEALSLLRDTAINDPYNYDIFALALPLARELNDLEALKWTCAGVLSKVWPEKYNSLANDAKLVARATSLRLKQEGRVLEATAFESEIKEALRRDIVVRVTWTGDADIAVRVKEPVGTICSYSNPQTVSGGVLLSNSSSKSKESLDGVSEYYVCPQGYAGEYDILLRRLWGKVSGGKATVEILTDYGTPEQRVITQQIDINEKDALIQVAVKNGHRKEPIESAILASVQQRQLGLARSVLAQAAADAGGGSSSGSTPSNYNPYAAMQALLAGGGWMNNGFPFRGAVGYRPQIVSLPEGATMMTTGVVSADRRYVRVHPMPFFMQIGEVFTFNFVSGTTGGGNGTTGGQGTGFGGGGLGGAGGGGGFF